MMLDEIKQIACSREMMTVLGEWPVREFYIDVSVDHTINQLLVVWKAEYLKLFCDRVQVSAHHKWPRTWWDAVKERWAPGWFLRCWPVEYFTFDIEIDEPRYAVCPHTKHNQHGDHVRFLYQARDDGIKYNQLFDLDTKVTGYRLFAECETEREADHIKYRLEKLIDEWNQKYEPL